MKNIISTNNAAAANNAASPKNIISTNNMNKHDLNKLSKTQLINLLLKQNAEIKLLCHPYVKPRKPVPTPRKSVKQMVQEYNSSTIRI